MIAHLSETFALLAADTSGHLVGLLHFNWCELADQQDTFNAKLAVASYEASKLQGVSTIFCDLDPG
jgi:hypothetical protein